MGGGNNVYEIIFRTIFTQVHASPGIIFYSKKLGDTHYDFSTMCIRRDIDACCVLFHINTAYLKTDIEQIASI